LSSPSGGPALRAELDDDTPLEETKSALLEREQHYLDWLFSLPSNIRYNFLPTAGSSLGSTSSAETRAKLIGEHNHKSVAIIIQDIQGKFVGKFPTIKTAAHYIGCSRQNVTRAIKHGYVIKSAPPTAALPRGRSGPPGGSLSCFF
jgi:hypothetical protein